MAAIANTLPPPPQPPQQQQMVTPSFSSIYIPQAFYLPSDLFSFTHFLPNLNLTTMNFFIPIFLFSLTPLSQSIQLHTRPLAPAHLRLHLLVTQGDPLFPIRATDLLDPMVVTGAATRVEEEATQDKDISRDQEGEAILKEEGVEGTQL